MHAEGIKTTTIVGLEIHVQLATTTKLFCGCRLEFGDPPNTHTCPVCLGLPGSLPVMNRLAYEYSVRTAMAMNCKIAHFTKWDRKSYYYPDLPKNYQISQYDLPLSYDGHFTIPTSDGKTKDIGIIRAHLEEDAGKNIHDVPGCTLVDLNRTGTPLLEIVTKPDISSAEEAYTFCTELQKLVTYLGVSEGSMQKGHMRFEPNINVSIIRDGQEFRTPISEVKNLNSFRAVRDAIAFESRRQVQDWLANNDYLFGKVPNENRGWNDDKQMTEYQRPKEAAHDYRYFPDPDLLPVTPDPTWIDEQRSMLPELPVNRRQRLMQTYNLTESDADAIIANRGDADLFDSVAGPNPKLADRLSKLMLGVARRVSNETNQPISDLLPDANAWTQLATMTEDGTVSATAAATLLEEALRAYTATIDFQAAAESANLIQVQDESQMLAWIDEAFAANEQAVADARSNPKKKKAATGFLAGQVMKISKGQADPKLAKDLITQRLSNN